MSHIIVVDDEAPLRQIISSVLASRGHTVSEARSAREALEINETNRAELVITDLVMREMDGTELLRRLRSRSPSTAVIAMSGDRHSTIYLNMARLLGADRILAKPFSREELVAIVEAVLANRSQP